MLRKSTGFSARMKRVGPLSGNICSDCSENCRCVAFARSSVASAAWTGVDEELRIGRVLEAMDRRRSASESAILLE